MNLRAHLPSRPTWRCAACGSAWPCSPAKLRLLAEYRTDRTALLVYLGTLLAEATAHLAGAHPPDLTDRFIAWARRGGGRRVADR